MLERTKKIIEKQNFETFSKYFLDEAIYNSDLRKKWWALFFDLFMGKDPEIFKKYCLYWPLYVYASWFNLNEINRIYIYNIIAGQIFGAFMSGVDVKDKILYYAQLEFLTETERKDFFVKFKKIILDPVFVWTKIDGKEVVFRDLIKEYGDQKIKKQALEKIEKIIVQEETAFKKIIERFAIEKKEIGENIEKFLTMMNEINDENFIEYCEKYTNPPIVVEQPNIELSKEETIKTIKNIEVPKEKTEIKTMNPPSYTQIKEKILQFFPKDETGEIIDTEGVFEVLEKTADKYGDPKIKELYYYNEATEKFEWSV